MSGRTPSLRARAEAIPAEVTALWQRHPNEIARTTLDEAVDAYRTLGPEAGDLLVNEDLHYDNVLRGTREPWLVIDPKPARGDIEYGIAPLLWNRFEVADGANEVRRRLDRIVDVAGLDPQRARLWTLARIVTYALWCAPLGFDRDQARATAIADAL